MLLILALIFGGISLWAVFGIASVAVWIISTILSIVFAVLGFFLKPALKFLLWLCIVIAIIAAIGYVALYFLPFL